MHVFVMEMSFTIWIIMEISYLIHYDFPPKLSVEDLLDFQKCLEIKSKVLANSIKQK